MQTKIAAAVAGAAPSRDDRTDPVRSEETAAAPDLPRGSARRIQPATWHQQLRQHLTPGQRAADLMRNGMGSWRFVGGFVLFMAIWAVANTLWLTWDDYPFILLNLFLSMLAGLQGAILLIAAKRQDAISAALAQHDFDTNVAAKIDIETLLEINRRQLVLIAEVHGMMLRLDTLAPGSVRTDGPAQASASVAATTHAGH